MGNAAQMKEMQKAGLRSVNWLVPVFYLPGAGANPHPTRRSHYRISGFQI